MTDIKILDRNLWLRLGSGGARDDAAHILPWITNPVSSHDDHPARAVCKSDRTMVDAAALFLVKCFAMGVSLPTIRRWNHTLTDDVLPYLPGALLDIDVFTKAALLRRPATSGLRAERAYLLGQVLFVVRSVGWLPAGINDEVNERRIRRDAIKRANGEPLRKPLSAQSDKKEPSP